MSDQKQPLPWPDAVEYADWLGDGYANYQRARAEAAMSRLRIAVKALEEYARFDGKMQLLGLSARTSLAMIGPLPRETGD